MNTAIKAILGNIDSGIYAAAKGRMVNGVNIPQSSYGFLADMLFEKGFGPTDEQVQARAKAFAKKHNLGSLDKLPAFQTRRIEDFCRESWALEQLMAELGIHVKGPGSDTIEKFYSTAASSTIFPAFIDTQIIAGILANPLLNELIAAETNINSHVYQGAILSDTEAERQLGAIAEGALMPERNFAVSDTSITLSKYGGYFTATYEALRLQRADVFALWLNRVGQQIAIDETNDAINTLISGDGNTGSAITDANDLDADVQGTFDYDECTKLFLAFTDGYRLSTAVTRNANIRTMLNMAEFKDPQSGFTFQSNGVLPGPMGASWHRWDNAGATTLANFIILGIDNRYALEQITEQGPTTETEKIIRRQIEGTAISVWTGWHKLDYNAVKVLDVNAEL